MSRPTSLAALLTLLSLSLAAAGQPTQQPEVIPLAKTKWLGGKPILGTYGASRLEDLERVKAVGMNVILGGDLELDAETPEGAYCKEHGIKVLYHLTSHLYHGVKLRDAIAPDATSISLFLPHEFPKHDSTVIQLDEELIQYEKFESGRLVNCQRGVGGTAAAAHREGLILCWPEEVSAEVARIKASPNLGGYYVLDDSPGDSVSALRAMYSAIRKEDPAENGRPVCAGFGDAGAMVNLAPGVCDLMCFYWYPVSTNNRYDRERTSLEVQHMLSAARSRVPGIPFAGIYQAFDGAPSQTGQGVPTPEQLREQLEDFVREGAAGLIAFICHTGPTLPGWAELPELEAVIGEVNNEILKTGDLSVRPENAIMQRSRIQPQGMWDVPNPLPGVPPAWYVVGPFEDPESKGLDVPLPPDTALKLDAVYPVKTGSATWRVRPTTAGVLPLTAVYEALQKCVVYAACEVISPKEQTVQLRVCSDDDAWIRLNGQEIFRYEAGGGMEYDKYIVPVKLPQGKSTLLAKVYNRKGMWGLYLRFTDTQGKPLEDVEFLP